MPKLRLAQVRKAVVRRGRHSAGNVTGQSIADSLALPARAQVSLSHDGVDHVAHAPLAATFEVKSAQAQLEGLARQWLDAFTVDSSSLRISRSSIRRVNLLQVDRQILKSSV